MLKQLYSMSFDIRNLQGNEIVVFKEMLKKYTGYDKIDLLIHKTLKCLGISKNDFLNRNAKQEKKEEYIKQNAPAPELYFCDGDKCEFDPTKLGKC